MSRFPESSIAYLKRVMLTCSPEFKFQDDDMCELLKITELNPAQIRVWGDHFRMRYKTAKERMDFLTTDGFEKGYTMKTSRYYISCFNVTPEFAASFKFPKSNGNGEFKIAYMEAAFNREAGSGEFFFDFVDYVWEHKLVECFQSQGAGQVMPSTFANNDGGDSASNALLYVLASQEKSNIKYTRGTCPPALFAKVQAKKAAEAIVKASSSKEFDEKTMAAMKLSLALQEETKAAVVKVEGGLESVKDGILSQVVKLEGIEHGVCNVIPDYQKEIALLKSQLAHKTALCDRIEGQKAYQTREINKVNGEKEALTRENKRLAAQLQENIDTWTREKFILTEQVDLCRSIGQARQITEELTTLLYSEHENKRQRVV